MKKILLGAALFLATGISAQTYFSDDFEGSLSTNWTTADEDGDGQNWGLFDTQGEQGYVATSASWSNGVVLYPNNYLISKAIDLSSATGATTLKWKAWGQDPNYAAEKYSVYIGTSNDVQSLLAGGSVFTQTTTGAIQTNTVDVSSFNGQTIYVAFRHYESADEFRLNLDDVKVFVPLANDLAVTKLTVDASAPGNRTFTARIANEGSNAVSSFEVKYTVNGNAQTETVNQNIAGGSNYDYNFTVANLPVGNSTVTVEILTQDEDMSNNSKTGTFSFVNEVMNYTQTDTHGEDHDLFEALGRGQAIILDFMASWCGPCQSSTPELSKFVEDRGSGNGIVQAYAISIEPSDNVSVLNGLNWNGGYYSYPKFAYSAANEAQWTHYNTDLGLGSNGIPFFVMICPDQANPENSYIVRSDVGFGAGMFNAYYAPALNSCQLSVEKIADDAIDFNVYPNPANSLVNVEFDLASQKEVTVSILNLMGQTVATQTLGEVSGVQKTTLDISSLNSGMYIVKVATPNAEKTQRISVVK